MNKYEIGNIIELKNGTYFTVTSSIIYDNQNFLYLVNTKNPTIHYIGVVEEDEKGTKINLLDTDDYDTRKFISDILIIFEEEFKNKLREKGEN